MTITVRLRPSIAEDTEQFFQHLQDATAIQMAAFTAEDPTDFAQLRSRFDWMRQSEEILVRTIVVEDVAIGHIASFPMFGDLDLTYWIDRDHWGKGYATASLLQFLTLETRRPLGARVAADNLGSLRVLEKCGFEVTGDNVSFANGRGCDTKELLLSLNV